MMNISTILFYAIAVLILGAALLAVTSKKIFRSAIWLLTSLVGIAGLYFWMEVEFIAAVQIIVYVGGIVVLVIFSIFLTQQAGSELPRPRLKRKIFSAFAALFGLAFSYRLIREHAFPPASSTPLRVSPADIGTQMLSTTEHGYVLPFEVVSMLLLSAMIGCIVIAMKTKIPDTRTEQAAKAGRIFVNPISEPEKMEEV